MKQGGIVIPAPQTGKWERGNELPGATRAAPKPWPELSSPSRLTTLCPLASSALAQSGHWTWSDCTLKPGEKMADLSPWFWAVPKWAYLSKAGGVWEGGSAHLQWSVLLPGTCTSPLPRSSQGEATHVRGHHSARWRCLWEAQGQVVDSFPRKLTCPAAFTNVLLMEPNAPARGHPASAVTGGPACRGGGRGTVKCALPLVTISYTQPLN